jgi:hypothetical protein
MEKQYESGITTFAPVMNASTQWKATTASNVGTKPRLRTICDPICSKHSEQALSRDDVQLSADYYTS